MDTIFKLTELERNLMLSLVVKALETAQSREDFLKEIVEIQDTLSEENVKVTIGGILSWVFYEDDLVREGIEEYFGKFNTEEYNY